MTSRDDFNPSQMTTEQMNLVLQYLAEEGLIDRLIQTRREEIERVRTPEAAAQLRNYHDLYSRRYPLAKGDLVEWKVGLKNKRRPEYRQPAVVVEILATPVPDPEESSSPDSAYFRDPLDLRLGMIVDDTYVMYWFDSARFQPFAP